MKALFSVLILSILIFAACKNAGSPSADTILYNGNIYTVNQEMPKAEAIAIRDGKVWKIGSNEEVLQWKGDSTKMIDLQGKFAMPGFIEGHGHFAALGKSLLQMNFLASRSWESIVEQVKKTAETASPGEWIEGRGWHQEKWDSLPPNHIHGYPVHDRLSEISPDNPVILRHASGHSLFANRKAMELAGLSRETPDPRGGAIIRDKAGYPIGVFEERAMDLIEEAYSDYLQTLSEEKRDSIWKRSLALAQEECLKKGVTSFQDAGSSIEEIRKYRKLAEEGQLKLRLWAMLRHKWESLKNVDEDLPWIGMGDNHFTCRAVKSEIDGALGSYGAWLLEPYEDKPGFTGQNTTSLEEIEKIARWVQERDLQLCVHAIGDRANREVLNLFEKVFKNHPGKTDWRWRIEHAQHLSTEDIPRFSELNVIASMQAIHCTSDAPFVVKRLGEKRAREGAYAWRSLLDSGAVVTNGTDTPVEDVDPLECLYATITRIPPGAEIPFFAEQKMSREEAIYSYTMANAWAAFEEDIKGSLEIGKVADVVVLANDLLSCEVEEIRETRVLLTMIGGNVLLDELNN